MANWNSYWEPAAWTVTGDEIIEATSTNLRTLAQWLPRAVEVLSSGFPHRWSYWRTPGSLRVACGCGWMTSSIRSCPGNKWRKLKYNLQVAREQGHRTLLSFGGAYSNHLRAVAAAGRNFGFETIGVVRGEEHQPLNPSLAHAVAQGMRLTYLDPRDLS